MNMNDIINSPSATIVDVRSEGEFAGGNVAGSINIPLNEVPHRVDEFKNMSKPLVLCCLSGGRSGQATQYLAQQGVEDVYNGGGWSQVQMHKM
jgi:rhodanese-related sulfurtransferase